MRGAVWLIIAAFLVPFVPGAGAGHATDIQWACGYGGGGAKGRPDNCGIDPVGGVGVQSVGTPQWGESWIKASELVLGVEINGDARAVPVKMLDRHEILNDKIGGVLVAVTYCPLCGSGVTVERQVDLGKGMETLDFAASGFLFQNDLVMWDAQNGILWNQIKARPIGTLVDSVVSFDHPEARLKFVPTEVAAWADWLKGHPESSMLQAVPGISYGGAYAGYDESCRIGIGGQQNCDLGGLHPKEVVYGIEGPRGAAAFPQFGITGATIFDADSGIVISRFNGTVSAYDVGRHSFIESGAAWLDETGAGWDLQSGISMDGEASLEPLTALRMYWFAWQEHHPDTKLWQPAGADGAKTLHDPGKLPGFTIGIVAGILLLGAIIMRRRQRSG